MYIWSKHVRLLKFLSPIAEELENDASFVVQILDNRNSISCLGTLISPFFVMTASACRRSGVVKVKTAASEDLEGAFTSSQGGNIQKY